MQANHRNNERPPASWLSRYVVRKRCFNNVFICVSVFLGAQCSKIVVHIEKSSCYGSALKTSLFHVCQTVIKTLKVTK